MLNSSSSFFPTENEVFKVIAVTNTIMFDEGKDTLSEQSYNLLMNYNHTVAAIGDSSQKEQYFNILHNAFKSQTLSDTKNLFAWLLNDFMRKCGETFFNEHCQLINYNAQVLQEKSSVAQP